MEVRVNMEEESLEEVAVGGAIWRLLLYITEWPQNMLRVFGKDEATVTERDQTELYVLLLDRIDRELESEGDCLWRAFVSLEGSLLLWNQCLLLPLCLNTSSLCLMISL